MCLATDWQVLDIDNLLIEVNASEPQYGWFITNIYRSAEKQV
jgi:hypothetical protein